MKIRVSRRYLKEGKPRSAYTCPVALALNDQAPVKGRWTVGTTAIQQAGGKDRQLLPPRIARKITRFDRGKFVLPFSFEVDIPPSSDTVVS